MTCKTCRYWDEPLNIVNEDYRACTMFVLDYGDEPPPDRVLADGDFCAAFYAGTGPDFGCIHWKVKDETTT